MKTYRIKQFILFDIDDSLAVQNMDGFTVLKNPKMISFFKVLDDENRLDLEEHYLKNFFGEEWEQSVQFMLESKLIEENEIKKPYKYINIFTNDKVIFESLRFNIDDCSFEKSIIFLEQDELVKEISQFELAEALNIFILNPFDYIYFLKLVSYIIETNIYCVFCFGYDTALYITNIYKNDWNNPCPKCFFSNLESSLRAKNKVNGHPNFQTIIDLIYNKKVFFKGQIPLSKRVLLPVINELCEVIENKNLNESSARIKKCYLNGEVEYDIAIHWELCDCLER
ncbi:McbB family protein [Streptococcus cameli]